MGHFSVLYLVNHLYAGIDSSIETDGIFGAGNIVVYGSGDTYALNAQL